MRKVIQMPSHVLPKNQDRPTHRSMILPDTLEESEPLWPMQRWLELADSALKNPSARDKKYPA